jgi:peptidoglycan/xylan/chitin deacetylase (PgdA/CDA1 family)
MNLDNLYERMLARVQSTVSGAFFRRRLPMRNRTPIVSFSFDDFPRSAVQVAGAILRAHGARGTYYASLGLMGQEGPVGRLFTHADLLQTVADGHELGCHSYAHCDAWNTPPRVFERSVIENREALGSLLPRASFPTLSYPINFPRPHTKRRVSKYFSCCRGGCQRYNVNSVSPTYVGAYFIELARGNVDAMKRLIDANARDNGWLVFATHDVEDTPTRYGCTPAVFEAVVRYAVASGARLLPVAEAWHKVTVDG